MGWERRMEKSSRNTKAEILKVVILSGANYVTVAGLRMQF